MTPLRRFALAVTVAMAIAPAVVPAQQGTLTPAEQQRRSTASSGARHSPSSITVTVIK